MNARLSSGVRPISRAAIGRWLTAAILMSLAACVSAPPPKPPVAGSVTREGSRWVPVAWRKSCPVCRRIHCRPPGPRCCRAASVRRRRGRSCTGPSRSPPRGEAQIRDWLMRNLQPYRVESLEGAAGGLITGYYEPLIEARPETRWCVPGGPVFAGRRQSRHAPTVLDSPAARHAAGGTGFPARTRARLYGGSTRRAGAEFQGSGRLNITGDRRQPAHGAPGVRWPQRPPLSLGRTLADRPG